jgi:primosomal protein N' (replication factor Y)
MAIFCHFGIDRIAASSQAYLVYYIVHFPLNLAKEFSYHSRQRLEPGCRVLVSLNGKDTIGITGEEVLNPPQGIRYRDILEVLDTEPIITPELMKLAAWMADYYLCSMGICLFSMLPGNLIPDPSALIQKREGAQVSDPELAELLKEGLWHQLAQLKADLPNRPIYKLIEQAEEADEIEVERSVGAKDKPRYANFVSLLPAPDPLPKVADRQSEAIEVLKASGGRMPMAELAQHFSYSVIKALRTKELVKVEPCRIDAVPHYEPAAFAPRDITLNEEQQRALDAILETRDSFNVNLLYGVTGSGKTEVYLKVMQQYLQKGKNILFLIPEIALTPQMVERFESEFGPILAINHSKLSSKERLRQWKLIFHGEKRIVVGARSAVFAPLPNLGLVIVDEEHEQSYKQESQPRYHGRDMAIVRAQLSGAQVIIGSATPALESWRNTHTQKYALQTLANRPFEISMPEVKLVDLRTEPHEELFSQTLLVAIEETLRRNQQVILFQNRRGYSSFIQCLKCGKIIKCPHCEISMYYHRDLAQLMCHYCGYTEPNPRSCPSCGSFSFSYGAAGTQKLEQLLKILFPSARLLRLDSDSTRRKDAHKQMYQGMKSREIDILLGTQMISKGLDFPHVTLVGVVLADISLNIPDFRSAERTFQQLTQVSGRSGRAELPGKVIIQSYNPDHYAISKAAQQDYPAFAAFEMQYRQQMNYPPFCRLARILFTHKDDATLRGAMQELNQVCQRHLTQIEGLTFLGPTVAPLPKIAGQYRYHLIFKAQSHSILVHAVNIIKKHFKPKSSLRWQVDVDPVSLM